MSRDAIVPEEWVEAALRAMAPEVVHPVRMRAALEAVVPLAEQRATRSLLEAREEAEGR